MKRQRTIARSRLALILALLVLINWIPLPGYGHDNSVHARMQVSTIGSWTFTGRLNTARVGHTATLLANGKVLVAGGGSARSAELYDSVTETWTATGDLSTARVGHTATLLSNGKVLVV